MTKQEMIKVLKDPEQIELFENPNYSRIVSILRRGELSIKEIHKLFNKDYEDKKTLTSIYRYMDKLVESDLAFVSREELKKGHLIERYYSRTAKIFMFDEERTEDKVANAFSGLAQQVYSITDENREELTKLFKKFTRDLQEGKVGFFEKYGEEIINLERKHGFKSALHAAETMHEFWYMKQNPEVVKKIFRILEGSD